MNKIRYSNPLEVSWKNVGAVLSQLANPESKKVNRNSADMNLKEVRIVVQRLEESTDPEVQAYCTRLKLSTTGNPAVTPSAITMKDEPLFFSSAAAQNPKDPMEDSAFEPMDWCGGDTVVPKTECSTTPPSLVDSDVFEEPLDGSASVCPFPVAVTIKEEPDFSTSAALQDAEDHLQDRVFEPVDWCETVFPKTECSTTFPPHVNMNDFQSVSQEPIEDPLGGLAPSQTESLPTLTQSVITPLDVNQTAQFTSALPCEAITAKTGRDRNDCAVDQFSSALSEAVTKIPLGGVRGAELQRKVDWDRFVASVPPPRSPTTWRVRPSTPEEKALFHAQESARNKNYQYAFTYRLHGYESVVGPARTTRFATRVCDAVARLPNGVGSLGDILLLLSDSQSVKISQPWSPAVLSKVVGELVVLSWENNPCLCYNAKHKMCVYLHRGMSEDEIDILYWQQRKVSQASESMGSFNVKNVEELLTAQSLLKPNGSSASLPPGHAQPIQSYPGKQIQPSNSSPQSVHTEPNDAEKRQFPRKFRIVSNGVGSALAVVPTDSVNDSVATGTRNGVATLVSTSSLGTLLNRKNSSLAKGKLSSTLASGLPSPSMSSSLPATTLTSGILSSSTATTAVLANGVLSSSASPSATLPGAEPLRNKATAVTDKNCASALHSQAASAFSAEEFFSTSVENPVQPVREPSDEELKKVVPAFLIKLWNMVEDPDTDDVIQWSDDGSSFLLLNEEQFAEQLLLLYCKHQDLFSFLKELDKYGFNQKKGAPDRVEFCHKFFKKRKPQLLFYIGRNTEEQNPLVSKPPWEKIIEKVPDFLTKLWNMVDRMTDDSIRWSLDGSSFMIHDERRFCLELLPTYYKWPSMVKFVLELGSYGFHKIEMGMGKAGCHKPQFIHKWFRERHPHLLFYLMKNDTDLESHVHRGRTLPDVPVHVRKRCGPDVPVHDPVQAVVEPSYEELRKVVPGFLTKLWNMVEDTGTDNIIRWNPDDSSFLILNERQFAEQLLLLYYKHQDMISFLKELDKYGFNKKLDRLEFSHKYFMKRKPQLLYYIVKNTENPYLLVSEKLQKELPVFLTKLWNMVDRMTDDSIRWSLDGASFLIHDITRFAAEILPLYYKDLSMNEFFEELYSYGFKRVKKDKEWQFAHICFEKCRPHLLSYIERNSVFQSSIVDVG